MLGSTPRSLGRRLRSLLKLRLERLGGREGDQRKLADRRAVLLLRRPRRVGRGGQIAVARRRRCWRAWPARRERRGRPSPAGPAGGAHADCDRPRRRPLLTRVGAPSAAPPDLDHDRPATVRSNSTVALLIDRGAVVDGRPGSGVHPPPAPTAGRSSTCGSSRDCGRRCRAGHLRQGECGGRASGRLLVSTIWCSGASTASWARLSGTSSTPAVGEHDQAGQAIAGDLGEGTTNRVRQRRVPPSAWPSSAPLARARLHFRVGQRKFQRLEQRGQGGQLALGRARVDALT